MKYTALLNLAGIHDAGLSDKTDVVDWVIIEYIADWYTAPGVTRRGDKVWINYRHLIAELPLLGLKTKSSVSRRITNLSELGLLNIVHDQDGRLYASIGQAAIDARCFRQARLPESTGVYENQRGVDENERGGVYQNQHSLGNQISLGNQTRKDAPQRGDVIPNAIPDNPPKAKPPAAQLDYSSWPTMPSTQVMADWVAARKAKRAPISQTVIDQFGNELHKAAALGYSVDQCLAECITSGWQGFKAAWIANRNNTGGTNGKPERISNFERVARDAERHIAELDRLDRLDAEMEQRNRAIGDGAVSSDRLVVSIQGQ